MWVIEKHAQLLIGFKDQECTDDQKHEAVLASCCHLTFSYLSIFIVDLLGLFVLSVVISNAGKVVL